jgi:hypothetical protein
MQGIENFVLITTLKLSKFSYYSVKVNVIPISQNVYVFTTH